MEKKGISNELKILAFFAIAITAMIVAKIVFF
jgi:hypothetical protein